MDGFERVAFAGLEPDRYSILWVRHQHAGHHELHFVTPRMELVSGKSLNIHPPGRVSQSAVRYVPQPGQRRVRPCRSRRPRASA